MALHAPFAKQVSVKNMKRQRTFSCWERISSKMFGSGNSVANTNSVDESETLEDGLVIGPAAAAGTVSEILIQNGSEGEADHHPGLQLTSVSREEEGFTFYRHVLSSKTNGPGIKMKLKNGDEIIMFSGNFVITTPHEDLLKQFYNLKVDGQSTFVMMIRRKKKSGEWKWLELFVILSSCNGCCNLTVTKKRAHKKMEFESYHIYKVPGTQRYVQIDNSGLCAKTLSGDSGDKTKVICKRTIFYDDDNGLRSEVTLRGITLGRHISFCVENQQIILSDKPHRFKYGLLGDKAHFMSTEGFFLGYDYDVHEMTLQKKEFAFEELPVPDHLQYQLL